MFLQFYVECLQIKSNFYLKWLNFTTKHEFCLKKNETLQITSQNISNISNNHRKRQNNNRILLKRSNYYKKLRISINHLNKLINSLFVDTTLTK